MKENKGTLPDWQNRKTGSRCKPRLPVFQLYTPEQYSTGRNILPEYLALLSYPSLFPGRLIIPVLLLIHSLVRRFQEGIQI